MAGTGGTSGSWIPTFAGMTLGGRNGGLGVLVGCFLGWWRGAAAGRAFLAAARLITHVVRDRERCLSLRCRALGTHLVSTWRRDRSRGCLVGRRPRPLQVLLPSAVPPPGVAVAAHLPSSGVRDVGGRRLAPFVTHTLLSTAAGDDPTGRWGSTDIADGGQSRNQPTRSDGRRRGRTPCCRPLSGDDPMGRCGSTDDRRSAVQSRNQPSRSDGRRRDGRCAAADY